MAGFPKRSLGIALALAGISVFSGRVFAAPGSLDTSFGTGGKVVTSTNPGSDEFFSIAVQSDGKPVAVGQTGNSPNKDLAVVRYTTTGILDTTFSGDGIATFNIYNENEAAHAVAIQPDGKILVVGKAWVPGKSYDPIILRYNTDGTLDGSFNGSGRRLFPIYPDADERAVGVAVQSDGRIVITGFQISGLSSFPWVTRLTSTGATDTTFSDDGWDFPVIFTEAQEPRGIAIQPDGRIVIAGLVKVYNGGGDYDFLLLRYNSNGTLDTSFDGDGMVTTSFGAGATSVDVATALSIQSDGKIVAAGYAGNGTDSDFAVARYLSNGTLDTSFASTGKVMTPIGSGNDLADSAVLTSDGSIVLAGSAVVSGFQDVAIVRYLTNGALDSSFGTGGITTTPIGATEDVGLGVAYHDNSDTLTVAGYSSNGASNDSVLLRYVASRCGNSEVETGEQCDDGNVLNGDCCFSTCQNDAASTPCTTDGNACTSDICNGLGTCLHLASNAGGVCRAAAGVCDVAETCDGVSSSCPADAKSTAVCRAASDVCDLEEACDGNSAACPADDFKAASTTCRPAAGICDEVENCTGSSATCPADSKSTAICRASAGVCDLAESCTGLANTCPPDGFNAVDVCRAVAGGCDVAESCTGASPDCPADTFLGASIICRASAGPCDAAETCTGASSSCAADALFDAGTTCRASTGECDIAETCTGGSSACPADSFEPSGVACGNSSSSACDGADTCDGAGACDDNLTADGTPCNDGLFCNGSDQCSAGSCSLHSAPPCAGPDTDGDCAESCNETGDHCFASDPDGSACSSGDPCLSGETCTAGGCGGGTASGTCCNDSNPCTQDSYNVGNSSCEYTVTPAASCRAAGQSGLGLTISNDGKARWKFGRGASTACEDFGSPDVDTSFDLCIYDGTGGGTYSLAARFHIPAGPTWELGSNCRWSYRDASGTADGVHSIKLSPSATDKTAVQLSAEGPSSALPTPVSGTRFMLFDPNLVVQFHSSEGNCWESEFTEARMNSGTKLKTNRLILVGQ